MRVNTRNSVGPHPIKAAAMLKLALGGLLLVFRSNTTYQRLDEARRLWGRAVFLCREIAQNAATALLFDETVAAPDAARKAARKAAPNVTV